ncbi:UDP-glucose pyrophosphorylase [Thermolongibacillus altinsuensis]|jgi:UTP--glucose-1-phosphate uridylyltransferase|uniref:UTP--glucose-1-phosphate uridylyltransferase n=1 Tax=Thermolongibacillus altinsuensis TaxID=575256 RepID=A0A4R1QPZ5_9BACL|nr:UTP--glucose-1-phosphate uridylyltransferase GalU [Thermolongibacillus altinsuensis]TCL52814.1 UDP-glucose pyrophosphorylase [Thermolongibacillus altinsuensis]
MNVRKAIIPAAGLGTRFLPATKAQPKEMLPIVDKPTIQYIVEEAVASGIEDILIISGRGKRAIEDHFDKSYELEETLARRGEWERLAEIQAISSMANIHYIRQKEPKGLGDAIYCARSFIGDEPFAVMLGDDIVQADEPCLRQLIDRFHEYRCPIIGVQQVADEEVSKYGIVEPMDEAVSGDVFRIRDLIEKPSVAEAPSNYAIMGRYILTPNIFDVLADLPPGAGGEIQLTDALRKLAKTEQIMAYYFVGKRYDVGNMFGFLQATLEFALQREDLRPDLLTYLQSLLARERED